MFERVRVTQSLSNPLRDTITDNESGLTMEVVQMSRELFVPIVHLEAHEIAFFVGFTNNPKDRYNGIYFIFDLVPEDNELSLRDLFILAHSYCASKGLPAPESIMPVSKLL